MAGLYEDQALEGVVGGGGKTALNHEDVSLFLPFSAETEIRRKRELRSRLSSKDPGPSSLAYTVWRTTYPSGPGAVNSAARMNSTFQRG